MRAPVAVAALALALAACSGSPGARPGSPDPDPLVYGGARPVRLQVPPAIEPGRTYPLVLVLHGYGSVGAWHQHYLQVSTTTLEGGAFVLAPDGTPDSGGRRFWAASPACCDFGGLAPDDVAYLGGLLDAVAADWPVDPARVFVVGHSNGGFMAYRLACARADRVTAIAGLAGAATSLDGAGCDPAAPVSVLHVHGTADETIAYAGGVIFGASYPGAAASVAQWAAHDGCEPALAGGAARDLESGLDGAETRTETAAGCDGGAGVELWTMTGARHVPSLAPGFGAQVLGWLATHPRPAQGP